MATQRTRTPRISELEPLHARLPAFWWSEVTRIQRLIKQDAEAASFEAEYMGYAAQALLAENAELARQHASALWAASHQLKTMARASKSALGHAS